MAINFDKTMRKQSNREMLALDQPLQGENEDTKHKDMLYQPAPNTADRLACETMADYGCFYPPPRKDLFQDA
jgi:hypothetical protein